MLHEALTLRHPYEMPGQRLDGDAIFADVRAGSARSIHVNDPTLRSVIERCLDLNEDTRATVEELLGILDRNEDDPVRTSPTPSVPALSPLDQFEAEIDLYTQRTLDQVAIIRKLSQPGSRMLPPMTALPVLTPLDPVQVTDSPPPTPRSLWKIVAGVLTAALLVVAAILVTRSPGTDLGPRPRITMAPTTVVPPDTGTTVTTVTTTPATPTPTTNLPAPRFLAAGGSYTLDRAFGWVCTGDVAVGGRNLYDKNGQYTGLAIVVPPASTFAIDTPYGAYCRINIGDALINAVSEMRLEPNCGSASGCTWVEVVTLDVAGTESRSETFSPFGALRR